MQLKMKDRILFIGDSITDCGRNYQDEYDLGNGFSQLAGNLVLGKYPTLDLTVHNRGINGDKLSDLSARWSKDCLALRPDTVTVLIGVNDIWHNRSMDRLIDEAYLAEFDRTYRKLLIELKETNPKVQLIILQPFILPMSIDRLEWRQELQQMHRVIEAIAKDFQADYIEVDDYLMSLSKEIPPQKLTSNDGIHPTQIGHGVIANLWLENIESAQALKSH